MFGDGGTIIALITVPETLIALSVAAVLYALAARRFIRRSALEDSID